MGSAWIRTRTTRTKGRRYQVLYRLGGRAHRIECAGTFSTRREAQLRRDVVAGWLAVGRNPADELRRLVPTARKTLADWAVEFEQSRHDVGGSQRRVWTYSLRWLKASLGHKEPVEITPADCSLLIGRMAQELAPATVRLYYTTLRLILDYTGVQPNPARDRSIRLPKIEREPVTPMSLADWQAIRERLGADFLLPARVIEATGLRIGELSQLTWSDVDIRNSRLRVAAVRSKSAAGQRFVQLPHELTVLVDELIAHEDRSPDRLVFPDLSRKSLYKAMARACRTAGIVTYSPHDLRHRRLSLWHSQGVPLRELQERAGHGDVMTTLRTYAHVIAPEEDE